MTTPPNLEACNSREEIEAWLLSEITKPRGFRAAKMSVIAALARMEAIARNDAPLRGALETEALVEKVYQIALRVLTEGALQETLNEDGSHYPIVDALTHPGGTIDVGKRECELIADEIAGDLKAALSTAPEATGVREVEK